MGKPNFGKRTKRYESCGERQTVHPETKARWPRRFLLFGRRIMPVFVFVRAQARQQSSLDRALNRARGLQRQAEVELARMQKNARKTQAYIEAMKTRIDQAATDGLTVQEYIERDRESLRRIGKIKL